MNDEERDSYARCGMESKIMSRVDEAGREGVLASGWAEPAFTLIDIVTFA